LVAAECAKDVFPKGEAAFSVFSRPSNNPNCVKKEAAARSICKSFSKSRNGHVLTWAAKYNQVDLAECRDLSLGNLSDIAQVRGCWVVMGKG
jgi:hypothetical protein